MNKCFIIGNLARDPELRVTPTEAQVCSFTVAVQRRGKQHEQADFIPVVVWHNLAANCSKYLTKGQKVAVEGTIQTRSYESKDGTKRNVFEIVATDVQFLSRPSED